MNDFTLEDFGDGRFALSGEMSFDTAERILKASEEPFEEHTQLEIDRANWMRATEYLRSALRLAEESGARLQLASALVGMARLELETGNPEAALDLFQQALERSSV